MFYVLLGVTPTWYSLSLGGFAWALPGSPLLHCAPFPRGIVIINFSTSSARFGGKGSQEEPMERGRGASCGDLEGWLCPVRAGLCS